jgi:hypothetical protein
VVHKVYDTVLLLVLVNDVGAHKLLLEILFLISLEEKPNLGENLGGMF